MPLQMQCCASRQRRSTLSNTLGIGRGSLTANAALLIHSRHELMKASGNASKPIETFTLTVAKSRDRFGGIVASDTGLHTLKDHEGVYVKYVTPDSFAATLGLEPGDGLIEINGKACETPKQVENVLAACMSCSMKVTRGGMLHTPGHGSAV